MMRNNLTDRLFDPIAVHETFMQNRKGRVLEGTNKLDLRKDYSSPSVLGTDMFEACQILTDYQWSLVSGPNTGTSIHLDPQFANSWNTVLQGYKLWAILPPDTEPKVLMLTLTVLKMLPSRHPFPGFYMCCHSLEVGSSMGRRCWRYCRARGIPSTYPLGPHMRCSTWIGPLVLLRM